MLPTFSRVLQRVTRVVLINLAVLIGLYFLAEIVLHIFSDSNPFMEKNVLRIPDPVYSHTLAAKYDGLEKWGPLRYRVITDSLGFRDTSTRDVPLVTDHKRIVFIGDSFTEGVGLPYQDTFIGQFAAAFPDLDVLNAGVVSYSPSVYFEKLRYFLQRGLKFDEAIVYIDISDIQDEATNYSYDARGGLHWTGIISYGAAWMSRKPTWWSNKFYIADFIYQMWLTHKFAEEIDLASAGRANWTFDPNATGYGSVGIEGAIKKAMQQMDRLYDLLSSQGIELSVGVYPWPQQLLYDKADSRQVEIWRRWCVGKCKRFFDHFPAFFRYKDKDPNFLNNIFIDGDIHYNALGNRILAEDLIQKYRH